LKGFLTYPRTKSRWIPVDMLKEIRSELANYLQLPSSFNVSNSPSIKKCSEGGKTTITLTPEGIRAYFKGELAFTERIIATYMLDYIVKTLAPPIEREIVYVELYGDGRKYRIKWSEDIVNPPNEILEYKIIEKRDIIPQVGDKVKVIRLTDKTRMKEYDPVFSVTINIPNDHELVEWMKHTGLGTEATRHEFPNTLRSRHYIDSINVPSLLGIKVSKIVKMIKLDEQLTSRMEYEIEKLSELSQLNKFQEWIKNITKDLISKIKMIPDSYFKFKCSQGHDLTLKQYGIRGEIIGVCNVCKKKFKIT